MNKRDIVFVALKGIFRACWHAWRPWACTGGGIAGFSFIPRRHKRGHLPTSHCFSFPASWLPHSWEPLQGERITERKLWLPGHTVSLWAGLSQVLLHKRFAALQMSHGIEKCKPGERNTGRLRKTSSLWLHAVYCKTPQGASNDIGGDLKQPKKLHFETNY